MDITHRRVDVCVVHDLLKVLETRPALCCSCAERVTARAVKGDVGYSRILKSRPPRGLDVLLWLTCFRVLKQVIRWSSIITEPLKDGSYLRVNGHRARLAVLGVCEHYPVTQEVYLPFMEREQFRLPHPRMQIDYKNIEQVLATTYKKWFY